MRAPEPADVEMYETLDAVEAEWDALADRVGASPFMRPGWLATYWRTRATPTRLRLVGLRAGGRLVGLAPLHVCGRTLCSLGHAAQTPYVPLAEPGFGPALAEATLDPRWPRTSLTYLPAVAPATEDLLRAARERGWRTQVRAYERTVDLDLSGSLADVERRLPDKKRANVRRRRRRLADEGTVTVEIADGERDRLVRLEEFVALEASGWKGPQGSATAIACRPESRHFFTEMTAWAAVAGLLRISFLRVDGRPVAGLLGLEDGRAYYAVRTAYDETFRRFSPSDLLLHHHIEQLCERGVPRLVILGRDESYKRGWSDSGEDHVLAHLFPPTPLGRVQWFGYNRVRPAALSVRRRAATVRRRPSAPAS